ncbi:MAG: winged helix-turn-helix domain-containing protein [Ruminococcaceae bacterium]|nr:winged helix-turn-helix domain-containing protein [Oscillospiraceae bacterium]
MIAILTTDEILRQMLCLETARGNFDKETPENATVWLLDLDNPPRTLPPSKESLVIGFSRTLTVHPRADMVLPLPYPTEVLQQILADCHAKGRDATEIRHVQGAALIDGKKIGLSPAEEHIFKLLLEKRGQTVSENELIAALSGSRASTNVLQVHIYRLRRKLAAVSTVTVRAVRGIGYRMY